MAGRASTLGRPQANTEPYPSEIADMLQEAIAIGDVQGAQEAALKLAQFKAPLIVKPDPQGAKRNLGEGFSVGVYIEDKDESHGIVHVKVSSDMTIQELKGKMLIDYHLPPELQKWIIGKRLPKDEEILGNLGLKEDGPHIFLYLVSSQKAGLSKAKVRKDYGKYLPEEMQGPGGAGQGNVFEVDKNEYVMMDRRQVIPQERIEREVPRFAEPSVPKPPPDRRAPPKTQAPKPAPRPPSPPKEGWNCTVCTYFNVPTRPGCEMCGQDRPADYAVPEMDLTALPEKERKRLEKERRDEELAKQAEENQRQRELLMATENYQHMLRMEENDLVNNLEEFECALCFDTVEVGEGVNLRGCLHEFCKECLANHIAYNEEATVKCPFMDDDYSCPSDIDEREIRALVSPEVYEKFLRRGLDVAEGQEANSYHCKTADCRGWCIYDDEENFFNCPACQRKNCVTCKAIHEGMNCKEYQEDLKRRAENDQAAKDTQNMLEQMVASNEAMYCPQCKIIVQKKDGCDWIRCTMCKTEICWVTKGRRWGPNGTNDTSGGCGCRVNGRACHPNCQNCH